jgi:hypothetical protein
VDAVRIDLAPIELRTIYVEIEGDTPLLVHRFGEKARREIADRQGGKAREGKKNRVRKPEEEFEAAKYLFIDEDGIQREGFPANGIKKAMISAGYRYLGLQKVDLRGDMHINRRYVAIDGPPSIMQEDVVRLSGIGRTADLRYRPVYEPWAMTIPITYMPNRLTEERIVGMLAYAGFSIGLGEHRPEKDGDYGRFSIHNADVGDGDGRNGIHPSNTWYPPTMGVNGD